MSHPSQEGPSAETCHSSQDKLSTFGQEEAATPQLCTLGRLPPVASLRASVSALSQSAS